MYCLMTVPNENRALWEIGTVRLSIARFVRMLTAVYILHSAVICFVLSSIQFFILYFVTFCGTEVSRPDLAEDCSYSNCGADPTSGQTLQLRNPFVDGSLLLCDFSLVYSHVSAKHFLTHIKKKCVSLCNDQCWAIRQASRQSTRT